MWDPCAVVPANPAYVRHPGELPGTQRPAVLVVDFSRGSGRQLETLAPRPGDAASDLAEQDGRERAGLTGRARTLVTRMRRSGSAFTFGLRSAYGLKTHLWILTRAQRALRAPRSAFTRDLQLRTFRTPSSHGARFNPAHHSHSEFFETQRVGVMPPSPSPTSDSCDPPGLGIGW